MIVKIYLSIWGFILLTAAVLFLTGNFNNLTAVVFGFFALGMIFMGMISVLPATVAHPAHFIETEEQFKPIEIKDKQLTNSVLVNYQPYK